MSHPLVIVAGAGVAAAAGLPSTFGHNRPLSKDERHRNSLNPKQYGNFLPELWDFARETAIAAMSREVSPIHRAIADMGVPIITQNIGGIHKRSGVKVVHEVYGTLFERSCIRCHHKVSMMIGEYKALAPGDVPQCEACGKGRTRPCIVLPGEHLRGKREAIGLLRETVRTLYIGVDEDTGPSALWHTITPSSTLVNPTRWGAFDTFYQMTPNEWLEAGCPL